MLTGVYFLYYGFVCVQCTEHLAAYVEGATGMGVLCLDVAASPQKVPAPPTLKASLAWHETSAALHTMWCSLNQDKVSRVWCGVVLGGVQTHLFALERGGVFRGVLGVASLVKLCQQTGRLTSTGNMSIKY